MPRPESGGRGKYFDRQLRGRWAIRSDNERYPKWNESGMFTVGDSLRVHRNFSGILRHLHSARRALPPRRPTVRGLASGPSSRGEATCSARDFILTTTAFEPRPRERAALAPRAATSGMTSPRALRGRTGLLFADRRGEETPRRVQIIRDASGESAAPL